MKHIIALLAGTIFISSCSSYHQMAAGMTGAQIGSEIGGTIGIIAGSSHHNSHRYGHHHYYNGSSRALGSLIGMGVGAAIGVGIANSIEHRAKKKAEESQKAQYDDSYTYSGDYQTNSGAQSVSQTASLSYIDISDITYMDADGDGSISKGETCQIDAYITNKSNSTLRDVTITMFTDQAKRVTLSNPLITTLSPGQQVHYTGRVYCNKTKRDQGVQLMLNVNDGTGEANSETICIPMK